MKYNALDFGAIQTYDTAWSNPSNCCGLTISKPVKTTPRTAGKGLRIIPECEVKDKDTPTLKVKTVQTKAGPVVVVSKHVSV